MPVIVSVALFGIVLGIPYVLARHAMARSTLNQLAIGMTKEEVRKVLGEPRRIREQEAVWEYSRWGNAGYVDIHFDGVGKLQSVNDESVFP